MSRSVFGCLGCYGACRENGVLMAYLCLSCRAEFYEQLDCGRSAKVVATAARVPEPVGGWESFLGYTSDVFRWAKLRRSNGGI